MPASAFISVGFDSVLGNGKLISNKAAQEVMFSCLKQSDNRSCFMSEFHVRLAGVT